MASDGEMSKSERVARLEIELDKVIDYHCLEYDITLPELIGLLVLIVLERWFTTVASPDSDVEPEDK